MTPATTIFVASAPFRTVHHGRFTILVTNADLLGGQHLVLVKGRVVDQPAVLCRVASACITSTALDADDCDCAGQNHAALSQIDAAGAGLLIYLDQEGRGNGLAAKVKALNGKHRGLDTFEAVEKLGLEADARNYSAVTPIVNELGVPSIRLLTNNPEKRDAIANLGVVITATESCLDPHPPPRARRHLRAKIKRGHHIPSQATFDRHHTQVGPNDAV